MVAKKLHQRLPSLKTPKKKDCLGYINRKTGEWVFNNLFTNEQWQQSWGVLSMFHEQKTLYKGSQGISPFFNTFNPKATSKKQVYSLTEKLSTEHQLNTLDKERLLKTILSDLRKRHYKIVT